MLARLIRRLISLFCRPSLENKSFASVKSLHSACSALTHSPCLLESPLEVGGVRPRASRAGY